jgi:hypothetical protein
MRRQLARPDGAEGCKGALGACNAEGQGIGEEARRSVVGGSSRGRSRFKTRPQYDVEETPPRDAFPLILPCHRAPLLVRGALYVVGLHIVTRIHGRASLWPDTITKSAVLPFIFRVAFVPWQSPFDA